jgi:hypothetical protein
MKVNVHPGAQLVDDRRAVDGLAEVAPDGPGEPVPVPDEERVVEPQLLAQVVEERLRRAGVLRVVPRQRIEAGRAECEDQQRADEQHEDRREDAPDREEEHAVTLRRQRKSSGRTGLYRDRSHGRGTRRPVPVDR